MPFIKGWLNWVEDAKKLALEEYNHNDKQT